MNARLTLMQLAQAAVGPGIEPPTPRWGATLAYLFGDSLTDEQVEHVAAATQRSLEAIKAHCREVMGRRRFRQFWARIGRRGRKSSTIALIAVFEALYGGHERYVMPGEQALVAVISKDIAGAHVITRFARIYLDAIGIRHTTTRIGSVQIIEIEGCQIGIAVLAAATDAPRGFALPVLIYDEIAHAATGDEYVDNDRSMLAAAEPAMAQFPDALIIGISTGFGRDGVHYERVERGLGNDLERDILSVSGPSWEWSKDITRERALEIADGNTDVFEAEFGGGLYENEALWIPQVDVQSWFRPRTERYLWHPPVRIIDMAESGDELAYADMQFGTPDPETQYKMVDGAGGFYIEERDEYGYPIALPTATGPILRVTNVGGYDGREVRRLGMNHVIDDIARGARASGAKEIIGDDRAGPQTQALFSKFSGLHFSFVHYANLKHDAVLMIKQWSRDGWIWVDPLDEELRKQALRYPRRVRGNGFSYGKPGQRDDRVCLLITLAVSLLRRNEDHAQRSPSIQGAPTQLFRGGRQMISRGF